MAKYKMPASNRKHLEIWCRSWSDDAASACQVIADFMESHDEVDVLEIEHRAAHWTNYCMEAWPEKWTKEMLGRLIQL